MSSASSKIMHVTENELAIRKSLVQIVSFPRLTLAHEGGIELGTATKPINMVQ